MYVQPFACKNTHTTFNTQSLERPENKEILKKTDIFWSQPRKLLLSSNQFFAKIHKKLLTFRVEKTWKHRFVRSKHAGL